MNYYIAVHHNEYNMDIYVFKSKLSIDDILDKEDKVIEDLDIDFEPDRDEYIDINEVSVNKLIEIK